MLIGLPKDNVLIMGANLSASIGMRANETRETNDPFEDEDPSASLLGPHGNSRRSTRCKLIIGVINHLQLRAASTFFIRKENQGHNTWTHPTTKEHYQLDHFLIKWWHLQQITNIRRKSNGAPSDHAAICMELKFPDRKWIKKNELWPSRKSSKWATTSSEHQAKYHSGTRLFCK